MDECDEYTAEESQERIEDAVDAVAFALNPGRFAGLMSCDEVEAMVRLFHVAGMESTADDWLNRHVGTDEPAVARERHGLDVDYAPRFLVTCPACGAEPMQGCALSGHGRLGVSRADSAHTARVRLAEKD